MDIGALVLSVLASVITVGGGYIVARRFQKLGGGDAQLRLNAIRKELDDAMSDKLKLIEDDFAGCKRRLIGVEAELKRVRAERIDLKQEILDLHNELRKMQQPRRGRTRSDD